MNILLVSLEFHLHSNYNILSHTLDHHGQFALDEGLPVHFREKSAEGGKGKRKARKRQQEKTRTRHVCLSANGALIQVCFLMRISCLPCVFGLHLRGASPFPSTCFWGWTILYNHLWGSCVLYKACRLAIYWCITDQQMMCQWMTVLLSVNTCWCSRGDYFSNHLNRTVLPRIEPTCVVIGGKPETAPSLEYSLSSVGRWSHTSTHESATLWSTK